MPFPDIPNHGQEAACPGTNGNFPYYTQKTEEAWSSNQCLQDFKEKIVAKITFRSPMFCICKDAESTIWKSELIALGALFILKENITRTQKSHFSKM